MARRIANDATWRRILTDPVSGTLLDYGTDTYTPGAVLDAHVTTRDHTCRFPGCTRPATGCDLDHTIPWPTGPTSADNLSALCRHHHRAKHTGWTLTQHRAGHLTWTTPTGAVHTVPPEPLATPRPHHRPRPPQRT
jgi:HNH endonuclease